MASRPTSKEVTILKRAKTFLKKGWCQFAWAKDKEGRNLPDLQYDQAVVWCLQGAIRCAADELKTDYNSAVDAAEKVLQKQTGTLRSLMDWNDQPNRTQEEVVNFVDDVVLHLQETVTKRKEKEHA